MKIIQNWTRGAPIHHRQAPSKQETRQGHSGDVSVLSRDETLKYPYPGSREGRNDYWSDFLKLMCKVASLGAGIVPLLKLTDRVSRCNSGSTI